MRTTLDIDSSVMEQLREYQRTTGQTLGRIVSELLAIALADRAPAQPEPLTWVSRPMNARVDLEDRDDVAQRTDNDDEPIA